MAIRSNPEQVTGPEDESTSEYDFWTFFQKGKQVMEWSRLIRFVLLGSRALEPYATLLVRVALGLFFAISGGNKLFVARHTQAMYRNAGRGQGSVPATDDLLRVCCRVRRRRCAKRRSPVQPGIRCFVGQYCCVAILTTKLSATPKALSPFNWLDDFLYLPEVLYVLFFVWLICSGPGRFSVDYWIASRL